VYFVMAGLAAVRSQQECEAGKDLSTGLSGGSQGRHSYTALPLDTVVSAAGLEPATLCLKGRCSTPELRARG
jgi:hypothetical protein